METHTPDASTKASKHALHSKTIIGLLMVLLSWANGRFELGLGGEEMEQTVSDLGVVAGLALGVWGRFTARKDLTMATERRGRLWVWVGVGILIGSGCLFGAESSDAGRLGVAGGTPALPVPFASSEPPPGTGEWLKVGLYILGTIVLVLTAVERIKAVFGRTPPLSSELKTLAERLEHGRETDRIALHNKMNGIKNELMHKIETEGKDTDATVQEMAIQIAKVEQLTETHTQQLTSMAHTQERILERLPRRS